MHDQLQEILDDFECSVLNYTNNKIVVDSFYSEERYADFLNGKNCRAGQGHFDVDEVLCFNKLKDNNLVIVQHDGIEVARYKYVPIFKATMEYRVVNSDNKKEYKDLTFTLRKSVFDGKINFIVPSKDSIDFYNVEAAKIYLKERYGNYKLKEWNVYVK